MLFNGEARLNRQKRLVPIRNSIRVKKRLVINSIRRSLPVKSVSLYMSSRNDSGEEEYSVFRGVRQGLSPQNPWHEDLTCHVFWRILFCEKPPINSKVKRWVNSLLSELRSNAARFMGGLISSQIGLLTKRGARGVTNPSKLRFQNTVHQADFFLLDKCRAWCEADP